MRYAPKHKAEMHARIVKDAGRRVRAEGISGAAVSSVMRDAGLTHGGFYKHFKSKDALLVESLREAFREITERLKHAAQSGKPKASWKMLVTAYLSPEHCDHAESGCPIAALAPDLARAGKKMKASVLDEITKYRTEMLPYMPGRNTAAKERAFLAIFSTMIGAIALARVMPDPRLRTQVLATARDFLLQSF